MNENHEMLFRPVPCVNCASAPEQHLTLVETNVIHRGHLHGKPLRVVICPNCGLTFLNPQPTPAALSRLYEDEFYDAKAVVTVDARLAKKNWQKTILFSWLTQNLPPIKNQTILDIGCGYGEWLRYFDASNRLLGIEQSKSAAAAANERFGVQVQQVDFLTNNCSNDTFDLVTGLAIIEHFGDPLAALVEMNRITKPGGHVYLETPDLHALAMRKGLPRYFKVVHTYYYTLVTLSSLLRKAGYEIAAVRQRPVVLSTSDWLRPANFWAGELDILARKCRTVTLDEARAAPWDGEPFKKTVDLVNAAIVRDLPYVRMEKFYRQPVIGKLANHLIRLAYILRGRNVKKISYYERQLEMLNSIATKT